MHLALEHRQVRLRRGTLLRGMRDPTLIERAMPHRIWYSTTSSRGRTRFGWRHAVVGALVACLHYAGSVAFYNSDYESWLWAYKGGSPHPADPQMTQLVLVYEFPAFQMRSGESFLTLAFANAIVWGCGATGIAFLVSCVLDRLIPEEEAQTRRSIAGDGEGQTLPGE